MSESLRVVSESYPYRNPPPPPARLLGFSRRSESPLPIRVTHADPSLPCRSESPSPLRPYRVPVVYPCPCRFRPSPSRPSPVSRFPSRFPNRCSESRTHPSRPRWCSTGRATTACTTPALTPRYYKLQHIIIILCKSRLPMSFSSRDPKVFHPIQFCAGLSCVVCLIFQATTAYLCAAVDPYRQGARTAPFSLSRADGPATYEYTYSCIYIYNIIYCIITTGRRGGWP